MAKLRKMRKASGLRKPVLIKASPPDNGSTSDSEENSPEVTQEEKSKLSEHDLSQGRGLISTAIRYVGTALMYESERPSILDRMSQPVFAHHVIVMPVGQRIFGMLATLRWCLPTFLVTISRSGSAMNLPLSVSTVDMNAFESFFQEVNFRKKYGIQGSLNFQMVKQNLIPRATSFRMINTNTFYFEVPVYPNNTICEANQQLYFQRFMDVLANIVKNFEPILID